MKDSGYTTKQITNIMNERVAQGKIVELSKPVSVVHFNKAWREFCIKKGISTKPTAMIMQQIENEIFGYRDVVTKMKATSEPQPKTPNPNQETALQLAELIKFLLELLRQSTGRSDVGPSKQLRAAAEDISELMEIEERKKKAVVPADPELASISRDRIASFFDDE